MYCCWVRSWTKIFTALVATAIGAMVVPVLPSRCLYPISSPYSYVVFVVPWLYVSWLCILGAYELTGKPGVILWTKNGTPYIFDTVR